MKKIFLLLFVVVSVSMFTVGCQSTNAFSKVRDVVVGDDYKAAGEIVGEAGYYAYCILKESGEYPEYVEKAEEIYKALDEGDYGNIGAINEIGLKMCETALAAKYGYAKAVLITRAVKIGGCIADRIIANRIDTVAANQFAAGFLNGVNKARGEYSP